MNINGFKYSTNNILKGIHKIKKKKEKKSFNKKLLIFTIKKYSNEITIIDNNRFYKYYFAIFIFNLLIIINLFNRTKSNNFHFYYLHYSKISLKTKGRDTYNIFGEGTKYSFSGTNYITEVRINENKEEKVDKSYYFNQNANSVEIFLFDNITNCEFMFFKCDKIIEIDLSNFNSSQVTTMYDMFALCKSLTSLKLSNLDTSKVIQV